MHLCLSFAMPSNDNGDDAHLPRWPHANATVCSEAETTPRSSHCCFQESDQYEGGHGRSTALTGSEMVSSKPGKGAHNSSLGHADFKASSSSVGKANNARAYLESRILSPSSYDLPLGSESTDDGYSPEVVYASSTESEKRRSSRKLWAGLKKWILKSSGMRPSVKVQSTTYTYVDEDSRMMHYSHGFDSNIMYMF